MSSVGTEGTTPIWNGPNTGSPAPGVRQRAKKKYSSGTYFINDSYSDPKDKLICCIFKGPFYTTHSFVIFDLSTKLLHLKLPMLTT